MFFLRTLPEFPPTFSGMARLILQKACTFSKVVHIVCDTYSDGPSIKEHEHQERGNYQSRFHITGASHCRPADFNKALLSASFKTALLQFLRDEWNPLNSQPVVIVRGLKRQQAAASTNFVGCFLHALLFFFFFLSFCLC